MKKLTVRFAALLFILYMAVPALAVEELIPVGRVVGLELLGGTVTVAGFDESSRGREAGLKEGDRILSVDGVTVTAAAHVREALAHSKGSVSVTVQRGREEKTIRVSPEITADGPRLGVYLKEGVTGIGTVTYFDPSTGNFAALGHGVNSPDGKLLKLTGGRVYDARVVSVRRGASGDPGQLMGAVSGDGPTGVLRKNTPQGVFGTGTQWQGEAIPVAQTKEIKTGKATIRSTISGQTVREYSVEIVKIYSDNRPDGRNMLIKITDPALLEATGGIVQGMSGSPLVQDGKLIGAVTHVLVNDPTMGYGIFIENMLEAAG